MTTDKSKVDIIPSDFKKMIDKEAQDYCDTNPCGSITLYNMNTVRKAYIAGRSKTHDEIREAVANYMRSEGCGCCEDREAHKEHTKVLAELLGVEMYEDKSGYNFGKYVNQ